MEFDSKFAVIADRMHKTVKGTCRGDSTVELAKASRGSVAGISVCPFAFFLLLSIECCKIVQPDKYFTLHDKIAGRLDFQGNRFDCAYIRRNILALLAIATGRGLYELSVLIRKAYR